MKERLIGALASIPAMAALTMCGACAGGCPNGLVNDPYPGQCPRYIDINNDGICDFSQTAATTTTTDSSTTSGTDQTGHAPGDVSNGMNPEHNIDTNASTITDHGDSVGNGQLPEDGHGYYLLPVSILLISGYLFTHYLFKKGIINRQRHRRLWNLLLTAGFLGTSSTGILLTFMINMGVRAALNPSITFWHVEMGILMVLTTLIHMHLYRKPFKNMFKVLFDVKKYINKKNSRRVTGTLK